MAKRNALHATGVARIAEGITEDLTEGITENCFVLDEIAPACLPRQSHHEVMNSMVLFIQFRIRTQLGLLILRIFIPIVC
jgi:hypothetical protein